jgi:hypothetical protein
MTNTTNDFTKSFEKMFSEVPGNFGDIFKNSAQYNAKFYQVALDAARENAELAQTWTKDAIKKAEKLADVKEEPADYAKVTADYVTEQAQATPEHIAAFAEVAKKVQTKTVELMMAAGQELQAEATKTATKATKKAA